MPSACRSRGTLCGSGKQAVPQGQIGRDPCAADASGSGVLYQGGDEGVGILFCGLTGVYVSDFFASLGTDIGPLGALGAKVQGLFHLATGFWLFYLMFADILNAVLKFTLYI